MACPKCGGSRREPVAPGYWRCTSTVTVTTDHRGPGLTNPAAGPPVLYRHHSVACGEEYQEGVGSMIECACGTFAIGRCLECRKPVCGNCSTVVDGRRLCVQHVAEAAAIEASAEEERDAARVAEIIRVWDLWANEVRDELARANDPVERIVRVVADPHSDDLARVLIPDDWPEEPHPGPDGRHWDHDAVHRWFLGAVKRAPDQIEMRRHKPSMFVGRGRWVEWTEPGWRFPCGSTRQYQSFGFDTYESITVFADGRPRDPEGGGYNADALTLMAKWAELPPLPEQPLLGRYFWGQVWPAS